MTRKTKGPLWERAFRDSGKPAATKAADAPHQTL